MNTHVICYMLYHIIRIQTKKLSLGIIQQTQRGLFSGDGEEEPSAVTEETLLSITNCNVFGRVP